MMINDDASAGNETLHQLYELKFLKLELCQLTCLIRVIFVYYRVEKILRKVRSNFI